MKLISKRSNNVVPLTNKRCIAIIEDIKCSVKRHEMGREILEILEAARDLNGLDRALIEKALERDGVLTDAYGLDLARMANQLGEKIDLFWSSKRIKLEHDRMARLIARNELKNEKNVKLKLPKWTKLFDGIKPITSSKRLAIEGGRQNNCCTSYLSELKSGNQAMFSFMYDGHRHTALLVESKGIIYITYSNIKRKSNDIKSDGAEDYLVARFVANDEFKVHRGNKRTENNQTWINECQGIPDGVFERLRCCPNAVDLYELSETIRDCVNFRDRYSHIDDSLRYAMSMNEIARDWRERGDRLYSIFTASDDHIRRTALGRYSPRNR